MRSKRRMLFAGLLALVLVGSLATAATAFPKPHRGLVDSADWTGVRVLDVGGCDPSDSTDTGGTFKCPFTATSTASILGPIGISCNVVLTGKINQFGTTWIKTVTVTAGSSAICNGITASPGSLPWTNQFCEYDPEEGDSEYWDRVVVDFTSPLLGRFAGPVYAQLTAPGALAVDHEVGLTAASILADGTAGSAPYTLDNEIDIVSVEEPCMWFSRADAVAVDSAP